MTNRKAPARKGTVQLIDAISCEIPPDRARDILKILADLRDGDTRKVVKDGKVEEVVVSRLRATSFACWPRSRAARRLRRLPVSPVISS